MQSFSKIPMLATLWALTLTASGAITGVTVFNNADGNYRKIISREGTLVDAVNLGHEGSDLSVNGVVFTSAGANPKPSGTRWSVSAMAWSDGLGYPGIDDLFFSEVNGGECLLNYTGLDANATYLVQILQGEPRSGFVGTDAYCVFADINGSTPVPPYSIGNTIAGEAPPGAPDVIIITAIVSGVSSFTYQQFGFNNRGNSIGGFQVRRLPADTTAPNIVSVASIGGDSLGICFDDLLDVDSARNVSNYRVNGGVMAVGEARLRWDRRSVELALNPSIPLAGVFQIEVMTGLRNVHGLAINPGSQALGGVWAEATDVIGAAGSGSTSPSGEAVSWAIGDVDVVAGGSDIWGNSDEFHFVYQRRSGDFDVKVRVESLEAANNYSKAGLMARETLDGPSATVQAYTLPVGPPGAGHYEAARRTSTGANTIEWGSRPDVEFPQGWLRLQRRGHIFQAFHSVDGNDWERFAGPVTQSMANSLFIGMATTSQRAGHATTAAYRSFSDVIFAGANITIQQGPVSVTVDENNRAEFHVEASVTGAPTDELYFIWQRSTDGGANYMNIPGATASTYRIERPTLADSGNYFRVIVAVPGLAVVSPSPAQAPAILTVNPDFNPPVLVSARPHPNFHEIILEYNEPMDPIRMTDPVAYTIEDAFGDFLNIIGARAGRDDRTVILELDRLTPLQPGRVYTVRVSGATDISFNEILPGSEITFQSFVISCGFARQELFFDIPGPTIEQLTNAPAYLARAPNASSFIQTLEGPLDAYDTYGVEISGYIIPSLTGDHRFFMSSDDMGQFYLSTDDSPANIVLIASEPQWNGSRQFQTLERRDTISPENRSALIPLVAGQHYYFRALMKEDLGGDNLAVAWQQPGEPEPDNGAEPIGPSNLAVAADPSGAGISIFQQPADIEILPGQSGMTSVIYEEDFNGNDGGYTVMNGGSPPSSWEYDGTSGAGESGAWSLKGPMNPLTLGYAILTSPPIPIAMDGPFALCFDHRFDFSSDTFDLDGGQVQISVNDGPYEPIPVHAFYAGDNSPSRLSGNHILDGQPGFTRTSPGHATAELIRSIASLGRFETGDTLRFQFVAAWDESMNPSPRNWIIDNIQLTHLADLGTGNLFTVEASAFTSDNPDHPVYIEWQRSDDGGASWSSLPGQHGKTLDLGAAAPDGYGALFRALIYGPGAVIASDSATVHFQPNHPPSFTKGSDITVNAENGARHYAGWATDIRPGPLPLESGQTVEFIVIHDHPELFSSPPALSPAGDLSFTPSGTVSGQATVNVFARDNGGTALCGQDTSPGQSFSITIILPDCPPPMDRTLNTPKNTSLPISLEVDTTAIDHAYRIIRLPDHGTLSGTSPDVIYTPNPDFVGSDSIEFVLDGMTCDPVGVGTITITVDPIPKLFIQPSGSDGLRHEIHWVPDDPSYFLECAPLPIGPWSPAPSLNMNPALVPTTTSFLFESDLREIFGAVNGDYEMQFELFDLPQGGTQVGTTLTVAGVSVHGGAYRVLLDFGQYVLPDLPRLSTPTSAPRYWLEIGARPQGSAVPFSMLGTRQPATGTAARFYRLQRP